MNECVELFEQIEKERKMSGYPYDVSPYHNLLQVAYESGWLAVVKPGTFDLEGNRINADEQDESRIIKVGPFGGASLSVGPGEAR